MNWKSNSVPFMGACHPAISRGVLRHCLVGLSLIALAFLMAGCGASAGKPVSASQKVADILDRPVSSSDSEPVAQANLLRIPRSTAIHIRLLQSVSSRTASSGEELQAELSAPVSVAGIEAFPKGTPARCRVVSVHPSGRLRHPGYLRLTLDSVQAPGGQWVSLSTTSVALSGKSHKRRNLTLIGGGSGLGALIGGLAGGGKGLAIGAASGAGAGLAGAFATGKKDITLPAESQLTFKTIRELEMKG